jgi:hypothetical protein
MLDFQITTNKINGRKEVKETGEVIFKWGGSTKFK